MDARWQDKLSGGNVSSDDVLGSTVDSTGYSNPDILRRIGLASSVMGQLD